MFWVFKQQYHILYSNNNKTSLLLFRSNNREIEGWVFAHVKFIIFTLQLYTYSRSLFFHIYKNEFLFQYILYLMDEIHFICKKKNSELIL